MKQALLAPVPCRHLASALDEFRPEDTVAFGSNLTHIFVEGGRPDGAQLLGKGLPVLIYASHPKDDPKRLFAPMRVRFRARFVQWSPPHPRTGQHTDPTKRPSSTRTDGGAMGFWEVTDLKKTDAPLRALRHLGTMNEIMEPPLGPMMVAMPEDLFGKEEA